MNLQIYDLYKSNCEIWYFLKPDFQNWSMKDKKKKNEAC